MVSSRCEAGGAGQEPGRTSAIVRRLLFVIAVAVVWAGVASAVLAAEAFAGQVNTVNGYLSGALYNATPYTLTKVAQASPATCINASPYADCWGPQEPAATIAPGGAGGYTLAPNLADLPDTLYYKFGYDAWVTYRVNVVGGAPEYMTFAVTQCYCSLTQGNSYPDLNVWNTTAPPPAGFDPATSPGKPPGTLTGSPQITYAHNLPYLFDQSFQVSGDYTTDAASNQGQALGELLNSWCSGVAGTTCSFTQTSPLVWAVGPAVKQGEAVNCTVAATEPRSSPSGSAVGDEPPPAPPPLDPDWFQVEYESAQSATLTVGGSVSVGTELNLFDTISAKISVEVEAEHEWQEVKTFTRSSKIYLPSNDVGSIWVAPTVATVTGTLVVSSGPATYTITNFAETRSGVSRDPLTPALNVITQIRPMTADEYKANCGSSSATSLGSPAPKGKSGASPSLAGVKRGQTQAQVLRELGRPLVERFTTKRCPVHGLRCNATGGRGGTWVYRDGSVVFGANHRVRALIYGTHRHRRMVTA
jgi:hypothetical protein